MPHNKITGGRLLSSATLPSANRAAGILRMAAMSLGRTETALGAFYRRLAFRVGKAKAITATARKLAILVYRTLKDGLVYRDPGAAAYDAQHRQRVIRRLRQRAANLGLALVNRETGELLEAAVCSGEVDIKPLVVLPRRASIIWRTLVRVAAEKTRPPPFGPAGPRSVTGSRDTWQEKSSISGRSRRSNPCD